MEEQKSPPWSAQTKTIVVVSLMVILAFALVRFKSVLSPLLLSFIIAYLLHPVASVLERRLRMPWPLAVAVIFILLVLALVGLLTLGGVELVAQFQNMLILLQSLVEQIPQQLAYLVSLPGGELGHAIRSADITALSGQLVNYLEPALGRAGSLLGTLASGALTSLAWLFFVLLMAYFLLVESNSLSRQMFTYNLRGYNDDIRRLGVKLVQIWNAFLRGQLIIVSLAIITYLIVLNLFGVRYAFGLALLAGLARFLPYIGPPIVWLILGIVSYLQAYKLFDMSPVAYSVLIVGAAIAIDYVIDYLVYARVMANTLKVHPAAILVAVIVAADMLGLLGVLIAAPIVASMQLLLSYVARKIFNEDPWPLEDEKPSFSLRSEFIIWIKRIKNARKPA